MPDLSLEATHEFWKAYHDPMIYRTLVFMESVENWPLDGNPALEEKLEKLGVVLDDIGNLELQEENKMIELAAYIKATRYLRFLYALDTAHPGAASKLLMHAETQSQSNDDYFGLLLRRNLVFERLRLLGRVFSPERLASVAKALGG
jgi:intracellular multiplication protein IcmW